MEKIVKNLEKQIQEMSLEEIKLLNEMICFRYTDLGYQFHEKVGEEFTWAMVHCPSMLEEYLDGSIPAPYEWLAVQHLDGRDERD